MIYKGIKHKKEGGYMEKVIEVKNLYKLYRVGDEVVRALDGVDLIFIRRVLRDCRNIRIW